MIKRKRVIDVTCDRSKEKNLSSNAAVPRSSAREYGGFTLAKCSILVPQDIFDLRLFRYILHSEKPPYGFFAIFPLCFHFSLLSMFIVTIIVS